MSNLSYFYGLYLTEVLVSGVQGRSSRWIIYMIRVRKKPPSVWKGVWVTWEVREPR